VTEAALRKTNAACTLAGMTVASIISNPQESRAYLEFLLPEPRPDGREPESRFIHCGMSWERYLAFDQALGDNRSTPRFYYLDGELEVMTTSGEHERIKKWLADLLAVYFEVAGLEIVPRGQATLRNSLREAGAEPDESWCIGGDKTFPDLVLEIALTSGGLDKLELYRRFAVPEVWFWRGGKLEIFGLATDASGYDRLEAGSRLLPALDVALLERCVAIPSWQGARLAFRAGLVL
jgi:Uma2 family endonuclease